MVKVREDHYILEDETVDLDLWLERFEGTTYDSVQLRQACEVVRNAEERAQGPEDHWASNGSWHCLRAGVEMAQILFELQQEQATLLAAILYRIVRERKLPLERVRKLFGKEVSRLVDGVLHMAAIGTIKTLTGDKKKVLGGESSNQVENIRKMLVAMIDDVRVALIKIAERTCAIRGIKSASRKKRYLVAREVFDIYAPLAHRLGIGHIKWELEDLSFRYLHPTDYKEIATLLDEKRLNRDEYIRNVVALLKERLAAASINGEVFGRAKHIYSIWRKMQSKNIEFSQVYDVRAVRILVPENADCYNVVGIVHGLWRNIPNEFDDYIASPKPNGYKSLHTAVFGPEGRVLEVQIRTYAMHEEAELGVCAHHLYKGTDAVGRSDAYEDKIAWLRQVLEWHEDLGDSEGFADLLRSDIVQDRLYIFTPKGHVIDMPQGSTPVDFAYRVHTSIGHRCRGAKINGRIVPLNRCLKTGDQVEIVTINEERPRRDWLNGNLGFVTTSRARAKIQHWFKEQAKDQNAAAGSKIVDREFKRLALDTSNLDIPRIVKELNFKNEEDMFASLGAGDIRLSQIINAAQRQLERVDLNKDTELARVLPKLRQPEPSKDEDNILIKGVGNLLTTRASCCNPVPGDMIVGFTTQGRGISVHRDDCPNLLQLQSQEPFRIIEVNWGEKGEATYPVEIFIEAYDRCGLLRDIMILLANENLNVVSAHTLSDAANHLAQLSITIEVGRLELLGRIMDKINQVPNVVDVRRRRS